MAATTSTTGPIDRCAKVAVVSSRQPRLITPDEAWLKGLRAVLRRVASDASLLVVGHETARAELIRHCAKRFGINFEIAECAADSTHDVAPPPLRDRIVFDRADVVYVLGLRNGGNIHQLLKGHLERHPGSVVLVDLPGLQAESATRELCDHGAQIWEPPVDHCRPWDQTIVDKPPIGPSKLATDGVYSIVPFPSDGRWNYLAHSTRSCPGPWPGESFEAYADSLFESRVDADHSALGTLRRIVLQKQLIATGQTIRDAYPVVSFTACPLARLPALHKYRTHRLRWDFEPYGLCIRQDWLQRQGARPVQYGDESDWKSLTESDRPFFQVATGDSGIDWSVEQEWRHLGDVDLRGLTPDDVLLFVPNFSDAKSLAEFTDWPITLCPGPDDILTTTEH